MKKISNITFDDGHGSWVMKLENGKVFFNREHWPLAEPDEFAKAVIEILEKGIVKMDNWNKEGK